MAGIFVTPSSHLFPRCPLRRTLRICQTLIMANSHPRTMENVAAASLARMVSPSAERNKQPILEALIQAFESHNIAKPTILEVASGTGQHAAHIATALPASTIQPTEHTAEMLPSIQAWTEGLRNVRLPQLLDASAAPWAGIDAGSIDVVFVANMCHISPWTCTKGLCAGAGTALRTGGLLLVYGPFKKDGKCTTSSNAQFDASLKSQNPEWGYRDIQEVAREARESAFELMSEEEMPANNFFLVFKKGLS